MSTTEATEVTEQESSPSINQSLPQQGRGIKNANIFEARHIADEWVTHKNGIGVHAARGQLVAEENEQGIRQRTGMQKEMNVPPTWKTNKKQN